MNALCRNFENEWQECWTCNQDVASLNPVIDSTFSLNNKAV